VRAGDTANVAEFDQSTALRGGRRGDVVERAGNGRVEFVEMNACELGRESDGELCDLLELSLV
jgi:hypothetical protein